MMTMREVFPGNSLSPSHLAPPSSNKINVMADVAICIIISIAGIIMAIIVPWCFPFSMMMACLGLLLLAGAVDRYSSQSSSRT